jgi:hypothetical protein
MGMTEDRCRLCWLRRGKDSEYCPFHLKALRNLEKAYDAWKRAVDIGWYEFLREVSRREETGPWAKEVAVDLLGEKFK